MDTSIVGLIRGYACRRGFQLFYVLLISSLQRGCTEWRYKWANNRWPFLRSIMGCNVYTLSNVQSSLRARCVVVREMNSSLLGRIRGSEAMPRNKSECGWCTGRSREMRRDAVVRREAISLHCDEIGLLRDKESAMRIYAIQVGSGQEAKVEELIRRFVDESVIGEIFVPRFEAMRRWKGEWHKRTERLTPRLPVRRDERCREARAAAAPCSGLYQAAWQ